VSFDAVGATRSARLGGIAKSGATAPAVAHRLIAISSG
jgi:hypothetical protein